MNQVPQVPLECPNVQEFQLPFEFPSASNGQVSKSLECPIPLGVPFMCPGALQKLLECHLSIQLPFESPSSKQRSTTLLEVDSFVLLQNF